MSRERETLEVDVLFVGGGPGGMAGALHLANEAKKRPELGDVQIAVLEKAPEVGLHCLSGAILDPRAIQELIPDWKDQGCPIEHPVEKDEVCYLTRSKKFGLPFVPAELRNEGNYIVSIEKLVKWLGGKVEAAGVNVFTGFPGASLLYDGDKVIGVRTGDKGVDKHGQPKPNFEPGIDIRAKIVVLAEGSRGSLTKQLVAKLKLDEGRNPQIHATGVKEVWRVRKGLCDKGWVVHTMGYPLDSKKFGGSFVYSMKDDLLCVGFVVGLDYDDPYTDPHRLLQEFKKHPWVRSLLEGGEVVNYGAKTIAEGGYWAMPKLWGDGFMLIGESAGMLNSKRLKGIHLAMKAGMLAAETAIEALSKKDFSASTLASYDRRFRDSWAHDELYRVRNFRQGFEGGFWSGMFHTGLQTLTFGRGLYRRYLNEPGHARMRRLAEMNGNGQRTPPSGGFDGKTTFDKLTDVFHSGTKHEENQPVHLQVADTNLCSTKCAEEYGNPCQFFCPAAVYEIETDAEGKRRLKINASNCVHCKTCDIMDPYQVITWVTPEGGGGPVYRGM